MKRLLAIVITLCLTMLACTSLASASVGTQTVYPTSAGSNGIGRAQDYRFPATPGNVDTLHVYLSATNTASKVELGIYNGSAPTAGTRTGRCVISAPQANAWNSCTFTPVYAVSGNYVWLAILQPKGTTGTMVWREGQVAGGPTTYLSSSGTLSALPNPWANGTGFTGGYQGSIYGDSNTALPPPTAAFTVSPASPTTGQAVTFDGAGSTCAATPCTYHYIDTANGADLGDTQTSQFTFQTVGTKFVQLTVTDAQNRTATVEHDVNVTAGGGGGGGCDLNATPANFSAQVAAATAGQTICLASGNYGTWTGTNKAITVKAASGATPTMSDNFGSTATGFTLDGISGLGGNMSGSSNVTIQNSTFAGEQDVQGGATGIVFNNDHFPSVLATARVWVGSGATDSVTVEHSLFDNPNGISGGADGVRCDDGTTTILDNEFSGIKDNADGSGAHGDPIQIFGGQCIIKGNYFHDMVNSATCSLGEWDGGANNVYENNVVDSGNCFSAAAILGDHNSMIDHNTFIAPNGTCFSNPQTECSSFAVGAKSGMTSTGDVYRNNVMGGIDNGNGGWTAVYTEDHNLSATNSGVGGAGDITGSPTLTGGAQPTTWDGFHLAAGSLGKNAASDGSDMGILASPS